MGRLTGSVHPGPTPPNSPTVTNELAPTPARRCILLYKGFACSNATSGWIWRASSTGSSSYVAEEEVFPEVAERPPVAAARRMGGWDEPYRTTLRRVRRAASTRRTRRSTRCARRSGGSRTPRSSTAGWLERAEAARRDACRWPSSRPSSATCARRASAATAPGGRWRRSARSTSCATRRSRSLLMHELVRWDRAVRLDPQASTTRTTGSRSPRATWSTSCCSASNADRVRDRDQLRVRDRLHQPAVRRPRPRWRTASATACSRRWCSSIQTDEARHAQIGRAGARDVVEHDRGVRAVPARQVVLAQLAAVRGRDRLRDGLPHAARAPRTQSFKEFMRGVGPRPVPAHARRVRPRTALVLGHVHRVARLLPPHGLRERLHLPRIGVVRLRRARARASAPGSRQKYPQLVARRSIRSGSASPSAGARPTRQRVRRARRPPSSTFCDLCQLVLCGGTPRANTATTLRARRARATSSAREPCRWIFEREPERYAATRTSSSACSRARRRPT